MLLELFSVRQLANDLLSLSVLVGAVSFIGKGWAGKYIDSSFSRSLESYKHSLTLELENAKSDLDKNLQKELQYSVTGIREKGNRYSQKQFDSYNELWGSLVKLKVKAYTLWDAANLRNFKSFVNELKKTKATVDMYMLLLEDEHLNKLLRIIEEFENFQIGKGRLIETSHASNWEIEDMILHNLEIRQHYSYLLAEIKSLFRTQINISNELVSGV